MNDLKPLVDPMLNPINTLDVSGSLPNYLYLQVYLDTN